MRYIILLSSFLFGINAFSQELEEDFKYVTINKLVKEFPITFDLSSPLQTGVSAYYILIKKIPYTWNDLKEEGRRSNNDSFPDRPISESTEFRVLNARIVEIIYYRDSIASMISQMPDSTFRMRWFKAENDQWYNLGEDIDNTLEESRKRFIRWADRSLKDIRQLHLIASVPKDTVSFINFLKNNGQDPKEMVLHTLSNHKIVAYGEIHRRLWSWDFCRSVLNDPRFSKLAGTIFMELSAHSQDKIDKFLESDTLNRDLIYETLCDITESGWNDKGMFDFIMDVWKVNKNLPKNNKIKIVAVDVPRPWSTFMTKEDIENFFFKINRDSFMAITIKNYLSNLSDRRNTLLILGAGHLCKSTTMTGAILSHSFSKDDFFVYWSHCPRIDNSGYIPGKIRHGIFDYAFFKIGNKPIAFNLFNSPFGREPFDGLLDEGLGTYSDNYDGYIFLGPLDEEPSGEVLSELYSDAFIKELDRRTNLLYGVSLNVAWEIKERSKTAIVEKIKEDQGPLRWGIIPNK